MGVDNGFESGDLSDFKSHVTPGGSFTLALSPVASGKYSAMLSLEYAPGGNNYRAEAVIKKDKGIFDFDKEYWFSFNYLYQDWAKDSISEIAPFQIHNRYVSWKKECQTGNAIGNAPFLMASQNDEVRFYTFGDGTPTIRWRAPIVKQQWQTITVHFKISWTPSGFIEAWKDGVKLFRVDGANSRRFDNCGNQMLGPSFNFGIYKFDWKRKAGEARRRTLIVDNFKIASGADGHSLVISSAPAAAPNVSGQPSASAKKR